VDCPLDVGYLLAGADELPHGHFLPVLSFVYLNLNISLVPLFMA